MSQILNYSPGQTASLFQEIVDINGVRTDDGYVPAINRIILPDFTIASGYPQEMTRFDVGLYYFQLTLLTGASGIGSYFIDIEYLNAANSILNINTYQIVVNALSGNFGITPF